MDQEQTPVDRDTPEQKLRGECWQIRYAQIRQMQIEEKPQEVINGWADSSARVCWALEGHQLLVDMIPQVKHAIQIRQEQIEEKPYWWVQGELAGFQYFLPLLEAVA